MGTAHQLFQKQSYWKQQAMAYNVDGLKSKMQSISISFDRSTEEERHRGTGV